jgi:uncharacterized protein YndB with AHSA1/START domain
VKPQSKGVTAVAELSIRKSLVVEAPQERAFRIFTEQMGAWWPKEHHIGKADLKGVGLEPKVGGRWYEIGVDGSECTWGKVLEWQPPRRLVLAWQISAQWQYDPSLITERVDFEHRHLDRFGAKAAELRGLMDSGWGGILERFAATASQG